MANKKGTCKICDREVELGSKGKLIHSPIQKGIPMSATEAEAAAGHSIVLKR